MVIDGVLVYIDDKLTNDVVSVQFKFPKSKKVRIRKKWAKNVKNYKQKETEKIIKFGNNILVSSKTCEKLLKAL